ncbi:MAG: ribokinase [Merismopedia sp. SIO2A8]|nr:ribokinase [Merismopedia sp. SIO2A8]
MSIVVCGSINMDLVVRTPRLPRTGETIIGEQFVTVPGGKGANQAVAAARLGAFTQMVGRVGNDAFGPSLVKGLVEYGVECDRVSLDPTLPSGIAFIEVDHQGDNHIVVVPGANGNVGAEEIRCFQELLTHSHPKILMLQLEIPLDTVITAAQLARERGMLVILDPAPAQDLPMELYSLIDILTPNQSEITRLTGIEVKGPESAIAAAQVFQRWGVRTILVTLGIDGVVIVTEQKSLHLPAFSVRTVDTVAAGDAFNGGLAVALSQELCLEDAVIRGMAVAALSVTMSGAQQSMPNSQTLETFLSQNYKN